MAQAINLREAVAFAGRYPLLAGVNLVVDAGEVIHLRGANGAGKTSLLRVLAGLVPVSGDQVTVLDYDLRTDRRTLRREVGLIGHQAFLYNDLGAEENIAFWLQASRGDPSKIEEVCTRVGLTDRLRKTPAGQLSTGQRRRVSLALMLARAPRLWLLDEPHAGLDTEGRGLLDMVIGEARASGATIVMASHEHGHADDLGARTVTVAGGRIVEDSRVDSPFAPRFGLGVRDDS